MRRWIDQIHVFLATDGSTILGVGAIKGSGEIMLNYVSPDARFRGVSKALMARLEAQASKVGIDLITVLSSETARRFYLAAGYEETGPPVKGFGKTMGHPMAKQLTSAAHETHER